jgi:hypothetical protein
VAPPAQADPLAVGDARGDVDRQRAPAHLAPAPVARLARLLRDAAVPEADVALDGPHDLAERGARDGLQAPLSPAALARLDRGPGLGAVAVARLAALHGLERQLDLRAAGGVGERDVRLDGDVAALGGPAAAAAPAAEERVEEVGDRAEAVEVRPHPPERRPSWP